MKRSSQSLKQSYESLKFHLLDVNYFPNINKILNLPSFVRQNQNLFTKLNQELIQLNNNQQKNDSNIKIKTKQFNLNSSTQNSGRDAQKVKQIRERNELIQKSIQNLKAQQEKKKKQTLLMLKEKKQQLRQKENEQQRLQQLNKQLKNALQSQQLLQLYQAKCRECESLRKVNNQISQQIKTIIKEINQLTGSEENPNMFFMNLKV